ncbi:hypothetical protein Q5H93_18065 [Hymenobacter sp. ASUV-10]|uniref:Zinc ribbon domain-containing protein n=1 Tax=Hymenobacter aranciens TaxID=3063996 RepID=A0ABT9BI20_9BACT|nr:hypothetical protein [Hymenobacter sp. ASUV-10]MDO7876657.1 hypothetical protein [Hymenobacter sp. ASUV-10]
MAKSIKAIKCPHCGSTQKTEVRPDVFRCEGCGTEYFLDNDDINVNYTVRQEPLGTPGQPPVKRAVIVAGLAAVVMFGFVLLRLLFSSSSSPTPGSYSVTTADEEEDYTKKFNFSSRETLLYLAPSQKPVLLQIGTRNYYRVTKDSAYAVFRDATTGTVLKSVPLNVPPGTSSFPDFDLKHFYNGELYLVANKMAVYRVDKANYSFKDVTKTLFQGQSELASGVATVEAGDNDYGDYFSVFTNDGRNMMFFPLINKVYSKDNFYDARYGFNNLQPNSPTATGFIFSRRSTSYPEDKIQLIKYQYRHNLGGAQSLPHFEWSDDYGGSGIFTDADPHVKRLITPYEKKGARLLSYADFTPGRLYFEPHLLYSDKEYVLISFKPTAAPSARPAVQCLRADTGAIVFTQPLEEGNSPDDAVRYPGGFALHDGDETYTISLDGKLTKNPKPV